MTNVWKPIERVAGPMLSLSSARNSSVAAKRFVEVHTVSAPGDVGGSTA
jgi:hypothetical protein